MEPYGYPSLFGRGSGKDWKETRRPSKEVETG